MIRQKLFSILCFMYIILGSWKGYVALFNEKGQEPCQIFPYQVDTLPVADQLALEEGIVVRNEHKLQDILEDYLS